MTTREISVILGWEKEAIRGRDREKERDIRVQRTWKDDYRLISRCIRWCEVSFFFLEVRIETSKPGNGESQAMSPLWHALLCGRCMQVKMTLY